LSTTTLFPEIAAPKKRVRNYVPTGRPRGRPRKHSPAPPPAPPKPPPLILGVSTDEGARAVNISSAKMRKMVADGVVKSVTIGRRRIIPISELHRLIEHGTP
jgi:excisionase family DNA binding protein